VGVRAASGERRAARTFLCRKQAHFQIVADFHGSPSLVVFLVICVKLCDMEAVKKGLQGDEAPDFS
jgi:hypothetical protein